MSPSESKVSEIPNSLAWLIRPVTAETFFADYFEQRPLVVKRTRPDYFSSLMSLDELDRVLNTFDLRYPNVVLKNAHGNVTAEDYTVNGDALDVAKIYQLFEKGSTIVLAFLDTVVPALTSLARGLERELSFPCQTNIYVTPAGAKGARHHYDTHDVFVLQVTNSKRWTAYGTPVALPLKAQEFDAAVHEHGAPALDFELQAGDVAYIPRGLVHEARSGDQVSLHITVGILAYTWTDLLLELAADVSLHHPDFRKALPPGFARHGFDRAPARAILQNLLEQLSAKSNPDEILDRFIDAFLSSRPPLLRGQIAQLASVDRLTAGSVVGARAGSVSYLRTDEASVSVDCYGRKITFPLHAVEAVRFALETGRFVVRDLPGGLDGEGKLALVRRLIREGLVELISI